jgi:hypothetical protein
VAGALCVAACGDAEGSRPLFGGPVTHPFVSTADVLQIGKLLVFEDCLILSGSASQVAIYLHRGYSVAGPVDTATIVDPAGATIATAGDTVYVEGSTIEGDGGIPCDPERNITAALIAGALGTCTPEWCD